MNQTAVELISPSHWIKDMVVKSIFRQKEVTLIHNGVDTEIYKPYAKKSIREKWNLPQDSFIILFASHGGLANQMKGGQYLIEALKILQAKYPQLVFLEVGGKNPEMVKDLNLKTISFAYVEGETNMAELYSASDVFVSTSLTENLSLAICEAMACATPVVAFATGGTPEIIEHGKSGLLVKTGDIQGLAQGLEKTIVEPGFLQAIRIASRQRIIEKFNLVKMCEQYSTLYKGEQLLSVKPQIKKAPKVSVLMPVYNGSEYLREAVESILQQTFSDFEFIIIDDGSVDDSAAIIESYNDDRIRFLKNVQNLGIIASLNKGIESAHGEYIARMDCDDISLPNRLARQIAFMDENPAVGVCGSWIEAFGVGKSCIWKYPVNTEETKSLLFFRSVVAHPSVMIRKKCLDEHNVKYSKAYPHAEDYGLWYELSKWVGISNIPEVLLKYRISAGQVTKRHRREQLASSCKIQMRILRELRIEPSTEEMNLHEEISLGKIIPTENFLKAVGEWFIRIQQANGKYSYSSMKSLTNVLRQYWLNICRAAASSLKEKAKVLFDKYDFILSKSLAPTEEVFLRKNIRSQSLQKKILYVGMKYDYGKPEQGYSFEHYNFYHTLMHMGYDVTYFDFLSLEKEYGKDAMNQMLLETVKKIQPELAFFILFEDNFYPEVIRQLPCVTYNWFCDDHWRYDKFSSKWAGVFNYVSTTDEASLAKYARDGFTNVMLTQWACNHFLYKPTRSLTQYDVSFVGQPHGNRISIINALQRHGSQVDCFGNGWPNGRLSQPKMIEIFSNSKINLNLANSSIGENPQIKGRNFEVPGCGGFLLTENVPELEKYYKIDKEVVCYKEIGDLVEKIKFYLKNDLNRRGIAKAGYERTIKEHTYEKRFLELFKKMNT